MEHCTHDSESNYVLNIPVPLSANEDISPSQSLANEARSNHPFTSATLAKGQSQLQKWMQSLERHEMIAILLDGFSPRHYATATAGGSPMSCSENGDFGGGVASQEVLGV